jgi:hypothetical protein
MKIESGKGNGKWAAVDKNNRLEVQSETASLEHTISKRDEEAYHVWGSATCANGGVVVLAIKNTSTTKDMIINHIDWQIMDPTGGTALPNASNYMQLCIGRSRSSGGTEKTPVNLHIGSGKVADAEVYDTNPTMSGTASEFDRWFPKEEGAKYSFHAYEGGAFILDPNQWFEMKYTGDHTSGTIYAMVGFTMEDLELEV